MSKFASGNPTLPEKTSDGEERLDLNVLDVSEKTTLHGSTTIDNLLVKNTTTMNNLIVNGSFSGTVPTGSVDWAHPGTIGSGAPNTVHATTLTVDNPFNATTATLASNASQLLGSTWGAPPAIGATPNTGHFTTLTVDNPFNATTSTLAANSSQLETKTWEEPGPFGSVTPNTVHATTLTVDNPFNATTATLASNASQLLGSTWGAPPAIGSTPNTGHFTTLTVDNPFNATTSTLAANSSQLETKTWEEPGPFGSVTPNTVHATTLTVDNPFNSTTSTLASNASQLLGATWAAPPTIGNVSAPDATIHDLTVTGTFSGTIPSGSTDWPNPGTIGSSTPNSGQFTTLTSTTNLNTGTPIISSNTNSGIGAQSGLRAINDASSTIEVLMGSSASNQKGTIITAGNSSGIDIIALGQGKNIKLETDNLNQVNITDDSTTLTGNTFKTNVLASYAIDSTTQLGSFLTAVKTTPNNDYIAGTIVTIAGDTTSTPVSTDGTWTVSSRYNTVQTTISDVLWVPFAQGSVKITTPTPNLISIGDEITFTTAPEIGHTYTVTTVLDNKNFIIAFTNTKNKYYPIKIIHQDLSRIGVTLYGVITPGDINDFDIVQILGCTDGTCSGTTDILGNSVTNFNTFWQANVIVNITNATMDITDIGNGNVLVNGTQGLMTKANIHHAMEFTVGYLATSDSFIIPTTTGGGSDGTVTTSVPYINLDGSFIVNQGEIVSNIPSTFKRAANVYIGGNVNAGTNTTIEEAAALIVDGDTFMQGSTTFEGPTYLQGYTLAENGLSVTNNLLVSGPETAILSTDTTFAGVTWKSFTAADTALTGLGPVSIGSFGVIPPIDVLSQLVVGGSNCSIGLLLPTYINTGLCFVPGNLITFVNGSTSLNSGVFAENLAVGIANDLLLDPVPGQLNNYGGQDLKLTAGGNMMLTAHGIGSYVDVSQPSALGGGNITISAGGGIVGLGGLPVGQLALSAGGDLFGDVTITSNHCKVKITGETDTIIRSVGVTGIGVARAATTQLLSDAGNVLIAGDGSPSYGGNVMISFGSGITDPSTATLTVGTFTDITDLTNNKKHPAQVWEYIDANNYSSVFGTFTFLGVSPITTSPLPMNTNVLIGGGLQVGNASAHLALATTAVLTGGGNLASYYTTFGDIVVPNNMDIVGTTTFTSYAANILKVSSSTHTAFNIQYDSGTGHTEFNLGETKYTGAAPNSNQASDVFVNGSFVVTSSDTNVAFLITPVADGSTPFHLLSYSTFFGNTTVPNNVSITGDTTLSCKTGNIGALLTLSGGTGFNRINFGNINQAISGSVGLDSAIDTLDYHSLSTHRFYINNVLQKTIASSLTTYSSAVTVGSLATEHLLTVNGHFTISAAFGTPTDPDIVNMVNSLIIDPQGHVFIVNDFHVGIPSSHTPTLFSGDVQIGSLLTPSGVDANPLLLYGTFTVGDNNNEFDVVLNSNVIIGNIAHPSSSSLYVYGTTQFGGNVIGAVNFTGGAIHMLGSAGLNVDHGILCDSLTAGTEVSLGASGGNVNLKAPTLAGGSYDFIFPDTDGTVGQTLTSGGSGSAAFWSTPSATAAAYFAETNTGGNVALSLLQNVVVATGNGQTLTLPTAVGNAGKIFNLISTYTSPATTIATTSAQTINGASSLTTSAQYGGYSLVSDGANWVKMRALGETTGTGNTVLSSNPFLVSATISNPNFSGTALAANLTATGNITLSLGQLISSISTGTAPFTVASTTQVANLNVSLLEGGSWESPPGIGTTAPNTGKFVTVQSTVATGTAPFIVASTTQVTNLNCSQLVGNTWLIPGVIGGTTPNLGAFTSVHLTGSGTSPYPLQCDHGAYIGELYTFGSWTFGSGANFYIDSPNTSPLFIGYNSPVAGGSRLNIFNNNISHISLFDVGEDGGGNAYSNIHGDIRNTVKSAGYIGEGLGTSITGSGYTLQTKHNTTAMTNLSSAVVQIVGVTFSGIYLISYTIQFNVNNIGISTGFVEAWFGISSAAQPYGDLNTSYSVGAGQSNVYNSMSFTTQVLLAAGQDVNVICRYNNSGSAVMQVNSQHNFLTVTRIA